MEHINKTLARKRLAEEAADVDSTYLKYRGAANRALAHGAKIWDVVKELEAERKRIEADEREGDDIFIQGVKNSKTACLQSIDRLIVELEGELS